MPTKTISASLDPDVYQRTRRTAAEEGRKQSAVVSEALNLYTALPADVRRLLRELDLAESPTLRDQLVDQVRTAVLEVRWRLLLERIRRALPREARRRFARMTAAELDALAAEAARATRSVK